MKAKTPMDIMLDAVEWHPLQLQGPAVDLPYATHSGVLELGGQYLSCYRLNTGDTVFDADDLEAFFAAMSA